MKTIIAGTRSLSSYSFVAEGVKKAQEMGLVISEVVSGACRGIDELGEQWAEENNVPVKRFPANWKLYGKSAGPRRNEQMSDYADALVAIWDGKSRGTAHMISSAEKKGLRVFIYQTKETQ